MPGAGQVSTSHRLIDGPHGPIPVRLYLPDHAHRGAEAGRGEHGRPVLVWAHGGAFWAGDLDMPEAHWVSTELAAHGIVVVSVDYRRSPPMDQSHPDAATAAGVHFPVASEEVSTAFAWVHAHADDLHGDAARISLGGASAGANLAAGASLRLRDAAGPQPHTVVLVYPLVHARLPELSAELAAKVGAEPTGSVITAVDVTAINRNYLGDATAAAKPYAFPAGHDLRGLPPTFVLNSDIDTLRASGEAYAAELAAAGVDVLVLREDGTRHGHLNEPTQPAARASLERIAAWLADSPLVGVRHEPPPAAAPTP